MEESTSTGTITGKVTAAGNGAALAGICVDALNEHIPYPGNTTSTNADGTYTLSGLSAGQYSVEFTSTCGPGGSYAAQYFSAEASYSAADQVPVTAGATTIDVNAAMQPGGSIDGKVTAASGGASLSGICVGAYPAGDLNPISSASTASDGTYSITGLPGGDYTVEFSACNDSNYAIQYYHDVTNKSDATPVPVATGSTTLGIDAAMHAGGTISGTVTDATNGEPLLGICVGAEDSNGVVSATGTGADGTYTITGLNAGSYQVAFTSTCGNGGNYVVQYYDGQYSSSSANPVTVESGSVTNDINAAMEPGGTVTGRVTNASGSPLSGICVFDNLEDNNGEPFGSFTETEADGTYSINDLPQGTYTIEFEDCGNGFYATQWYDGQSSQSDANPVTMPAGGTASGIDAAMAAGAPSGPAVSGVLPPSGPVSGGESVTVSGSGFSTAPGGTSVQFGSAVSSSVSCSSSTSCRALVPVASGPGQVDVTVTVAGATSAVSPADSFTYYTPGLLRVTTSPAVPSQITVDGVFSDTWGLTWVKEAPGSHRVCFSGVQGFTAPACQTVDVTSGQTTTVMGAFTARGYLHVVSSPAVPTQISVDGVPRDDWGLYTDVPVGPHQVCFGAVDGYAAPSCQSVTVTAGQTSTVTGNFTASAGAAGLSGVGLLRVTTSPALPSQISVDGVYADTWGLTWLELSPGSHQVCFSDVQGFTPPACQTVSVTAGQTTTVQGSFTARGYLHATTSPAVAGTIFVGGAPADDWGVWTDLPAGNWPVCYGAVPGHTTPACQTATITAGQTTTITGTYQ